MSKKLLKVDYSPSFKGISSFLGLPMIAIGAFCFAGVSEGLSFLFIAITLVVTGLLMLLKLRGVVIDPDKKAIRTYNDYLLFKIGTWESLKDYTKVKIFFEKSRFYAGRTRGSATSINSYEVCLNKPNGEKYVLKEYQNHKPARELMKKVAEALNIDAVDEIIRVK